MKSLAVLLISVVPLLNANILLYILPFANLFNSEQELCQRLNKTLKSALHGDISWKTRDDGVRTESSSYVLPGNFFDLEGKQSNDLVTKHFTFNYDPVRKLALNITTKLPRQANINELMRDGTVRTIFPVNYQISEYTYDNDGVKASFYLIQGERCKAKYNRKRGILTNKRCWNTPSLCRGSQGECLMNDDENVDCYDAVTGEGKKQDRSNEIHYSVEIGERIYWKSHFNMNLYHASGSDHSLYKWKCTDQGEHVTCDYVDYDSVNSLKNRNLFKSNQKLCKKLNNTLNSEQNDLIDMPSFEEHSLFDDLYTLPGNFFDVEGEESDDLVTRKFLFNYNKPILNITTKLPRNVNFNELISDKTMRNIFPANYRISVHSDDRIGGVYYYLIEGERCKAEYDRTTKKLVNKRCWDTPSFCRGFRANCILNDDENRLCYDAFTGEGEQQRKPGEIHYSMDVGERVFWKIHPIKNREGYKAWTYKWNCTDLKEYVFCDFIVDGEYPVLTLKTLSGFKG